ncbi:MAG: hypothetical protein R3C10_06595 [Pirellulales bacterium]
MKRIVLRLTAVTFVALVMIALTGCDKSEQAPAPAGDAAESDHSHAHDAHSHAAHAPHDGDLVELGGAALHAEVVHDEAAGTIAIYLLDGSAQDPTAVEKVVVNLSHDGQPEQFVLEAVAEAGETAGTSSHFTSSDARLVELLDDDHVEAQVVVDVAGKQYRGALAHAHDHAEDHDHGDDHDHAHNDDDHDHDHVDEAGDHDH